MLPAGRCLLVVVVFVVAVVERGVGAVFVVIHGGEKLRVNSIKSGSQTRR